MLLPWSQFVAIIIPWFPLKEEECMEEQIELTDLTNKTSNANVCIILVYTNKYSQYILVDETD